MTVIAPPPTLPMGTVTHRYLGVAQDGSDTDTAPDLHLLSGVTGTISPDTGRLVHTVGGVSTTLERLAVKIRYDQMGNLIHLDPRNDAPLTGPLRLPGNDATVAPHIGYTVQWTVPMAGGKNRTWQGRFEVAAGGTVDLGTVALQSVSGNPDRIYADLLEAASDLQATIDGVADQLPGIVEEIRDSNVVTATSVRRIIAAQEGTSPDVADGDLVVYYTLAGANYYDDFLTHPVGSAPTGWSQPWAQTDSWKVQSVAGALGGKALVVSPTTAAWHALTLDLTATDPDRADVEVLMRQKASSGGYLGAAVLHATGAAATTRGWRLGPTNASSFGVGDLTNGVYGSRAAAPISPAAAAEAWYFVRARIEGSTKMVKFWRDGTPEPETWMAQTTSSPTPTPPVGPSGILTSNYLASPLTVTIDWVAIATGGRTARPL